MPEGDATGPEGRGPRTGQGRGQSLEAKLSVFDSIGTSIDDLVKGVKETAKSAKTAAYYTYYTAKAAAGIGAGLLMAGSPRMLTFPIGMAAGTYLGSKIKKEKLSFKDRYKQVANELTVGGILGGLLHYIFIGVNGVAGAVKSVYGKIAGLITGAAGSLTTMPFFMGTHEYLNRALISDYKPVPVGKVVKRMTGPMLPLLPLIMANYSVVPEYLGPKYQMPLASGISSLYGMLKGEKKKEEKKAPDQNQLANAMQQYGAPS